MITDKEKELITGEMLSEVLRMGRVEIVDFTYDRVHYYYAVLTAPDDSIDVNEDISIYELKDKLEEWLRREAFLMDNRLMITYFGGLVKISFKIGTGFSETADSKLEALLKLYHEIKKA